jgi:peptide/nickel transport system substrate-binding protein
MRPLGVQIWALAYRSGEAWNEAGWSNAEFDAILTQAMSIADADAPARGGPHRAGSSRSRACDPALLAVALPPLPDGFTGVDMHITFEHHHYKWARTA